MNTAEREKTAARMYCASFKALTTRGVEYDLADEASLILERESFIGITYQRTDQEQEIINRVLPYLTANN